MTVPTASPTARTTVWTIGHGTLPADDFAALLHGVGLERVVDVRSYPSSHHNPQYGQDQLERWLPRAEVDYRWMRALGGRRKPVAGSKHVALRHDAFRAYADHMETPDFAAGVDELLGLAAVPTTVMCSESVWWRCHRRLLADHLVLVRGVDVIHLMHDGRLTPHVPTDGARLTDGGELVYDVGATPPLLDG